jgi:ABC-type uncharacterized transport system ATPase subunit
MLKQITEDMQQRIKKALHLPWGEIVKHGLVKKCVAAVKMIILDVPTRVLSQDESNPIQQKQQLQMLDGRRNQRCVS